MPLPIPVNNYTYIYLNDLQKWNEGDDEFIECEFVESATKKIGDLIFSFFMSQGEAEENCVRLETKSCRISWRKFMVKYDRT